MAELIWAALIGVLKYSLIIIWLPFGLLLKNREYIIAIVPYLVVGVLALLAAGFAFCLVVSAIRWGFIGVRGTYLICKNIIKAFMPVSAGSDHEAELDEDEDESEELSPYQILGVTPGLSSSELNARYRQLMSANHPDKVAQLDPEIQAFASERSRRIIEAYEAISAGES
jgi:hypothetical protein